MMSHASTGSSLTRSRSTSDWLIADSATSGPRIQSSSPRPVVAAHQDHREVLDLAGLDQGQRLEQLVERPEPARVDHERVGVLHEHDLAGEEVAELDAEVHVRVEPLLHRQLDVAADRQAAALLAAAVGGRHDPRPAAGDDRVATLREQRRRGGARPRSTASLRASAPIRRRSRRGRPTRARRTRRRTRRRSAAPATGRCRGRPDGSGRSRSRSSSVRLPRRVATWSFSGRMTRRPLRRRLVSSSRPFGVVGAIWDGVVGRMVHRG